MTLKGSVAIPEFAPNDSFFALVRPAAGADVDLTAIDKLAFSMRFDTNLDSGQASLADIKAAALGATIDASLDMTPSGGGTVYRGAIKTSLFSPEASAKLFANLLSDKVDLHELGGVALDARFAYDPQARHGDPCAVQSRSIRVERYRQRSGPQRVVESRVER